MHRSVVSLNLFFVQALYAACDFLFYDFYPFLAYTGLSAVFLITRDDTGYLFDERLRRPFILFSGSDILLVPLHAVSDRFLFGAKVGCRA